MEEEKSMQNWFSVDEHKSTLVVPSVFLKTRFVQGMYLGFVDMLR